MAGGSPLTRVLAAVDLTPMGRRVAERARLLAEANGASLTLVHVVEAGSDQLMSPVERAELRLAAKDTAVHLAEWIQSRCAIDVDLVTPRGNPVRQIAKLAKESDVVLAGTSSIDSSHVGPVTRRLARMSRVGVIAVRRQPRGPYRRVLAAVDLSDSSRQAVELALRLAPDAEIIATHAVASRFDPMLADAGMSSGRIDELRTKRIAQAKEAMQEFVAPWSDVAAQVVSGPPSEALNEAVRRGSCDLVTVASRGGAGDSMVLLGGVAEEVMQSAPCDVAVARVDSIFRRP